MNLFTTFLLVFGVGITGVAKEAGLNILQKIPRQVKGKNNARQYGSHVYEPYFIR